MTFARPSPKREESLVPIIDAKVPPQSHVRFLSPPKARRKRSRFRTVRHVLAGARTVARRRGLTYFAYLVKGYCWPALAQRVIFGKPDGLTARALRTLARESDSAAVVADVLTNNGAVIVRRRYTAPDRFRRESAAFQKLALLGLAPPSQIRQTGDLVVELGPFHGRAVDLHDHRESLERFVDRIHAAGVTGLSLDGSDVWVNDSGQLLAAGFRRARLHAAPRGLRFRYFRDRDREQFNTRFGLSILTERSARAALAACGSELRGSTPYGGWYAGIDFGDGLAVGQFLGTDNGTGRWEYLNGCVVNPLVAGKRVLDIGTNNGSMAIMMLRAGASEVVGVELSPHYARAAHLVRRVFEWKDMREYPLTLQNRSMLDVLTEDWGRFDVVTAFCSLYCVEEEWMERIVRRVAELAPVMVVQANMPKPGRQPHKPRAGAAFLRRLLETNGFPHVEEFGESEYARPLLVGRKTRV